MSEQLKNSMTGLRPSMLSLSITSKSALYAAYMPFLKRGGIFLPTNKPYQLGDEVFLLLQLLDDPTKQAIAGKVVWITPGGGTTGKQQGIGIEFGEDETSQALRSKIDTIVGPYLASPRPTHTL